MPAPQPTAIPDDVTSIVLGAAETAGTGLVDRGFGWIDAHPAASGILFGIGMGAILARLALPKLQRWAMSTETKWDDRIVSVVRWLVGVVEDRVEKRRK